MDKVDKEFGEAILKYLLSGSEIVTVSMFGTLTFFHQPPASSKSNVSLLIDTRRIIFDGSFTESVEQAPELADEKIWERYFSFRDKKIVNLELGETIPHLLLYFENSKTIQISGHDNKYESWSINAGQYSVVAIPGDGLAIWAPEDFKGYSKWRSNWKDGTEE